MSPPRGIVPTQGTGAPAAVRPKSAQRVKQAIRLWMVHRFTGTTGEEESEEDSGIASEEEIAS